jgi:hypothetical protein
MFYFLRDPHLSNQRIAHQGLVWYVEISVHLQWTVSLLLVPYRHLIMSSVQMSESRRYRLCLRGLYKIDHHLSMVHDAWWMMHDAWCMMHDDIWLVVLSPSVLGRSSISQILFSIVSKSFTPISPFSNKKSIDGNAKVFTASIFYTISNNEDIIFSNKASISLSLNFADLNLIVVRAAIGASKYLIDSAVVKFGISFPRNWKNNFRWVRFLSSSHI